MVCRYPPIQHSNQQGNGRETARHRSNATGSPSHRNAVWQDLLQLDATLQIPQKLRKRFRYGHGQPQCAACKAMEAINMYKLYMGLSETHCAGRTLTAM